MYSILTGNKVSEAKANPIQILKKTVDKSLVSPAIDSILIKYFKGQNNNYCSLIDNKASEAQANPNQKLNDASFESPVKDTVPRHLIGIKVPEARAKINQNLKKTVNTSFESSYVDSVPMKYYHKSYFHLQAKKPYLAPKCYVIEKRLLLNEPTDPTIQKDTDWTKKLLEKWC